MTDVYSHFNSLLYKICVLKGRVFSTTIQHKMITRFFKIWEILASARFTNSKSCLKINTCILIVVSEKQTYLLRIASSIREANNPCEWHGCTFCFSVSSSSSGSASLSHFMNCVQLLRATPWTEKFYSGIRLRFDIKRYICLVLAYHYVKYLALLLFWVLISLPVKESLLKIRIVCRFRWESYLLMVWITIWNKKVSLQYEQKQNWNIWHCVMLSSVKNMRKNVKK